MGWGQGGSRGHGAMALTVYSACFFPYHFIHFLNSRSMVWKEHVPSSPSETQGPRRQEAHVPTHSQAPADPTASRALAGPHCLGWQFHLQHSPAEKHPRVLDTLLQGTAMAQEHPHQAQLTLSPGQRLQWGGSKGQPSTAEKGNGRGRGGAVSQGVQSGGAKHNSSARRGTVTSSQQSWSAIPGQWDQGPRGLPRLLPAPQWMWHLQEGCCCKHMHLIQPKPLGLQGLAPGGQALEGRA